MKITIKLTEYGNDGSENIVPCETLSQALAILDENPHVCMTIADEDSTAFLDIQTTVNPEVVSYNY